MGHELSFNFSKPLIYSLIPRNFHISDFFFFLVDVGVCSSERSREGMLFIVGTTSHYVSFYLELLRIPFLKYKILIQSNFLVSCLCMNVVGLFIKEGGPGSRGYCSSLAPHYARFTFAFFNNFSFFFPN